ncbi:MAG: esterase-like activity of phytase family protein [Pseudomonadota bacterium]
MLQSNLTRIALATLMVIATGSPSSAKDIKIKAKPIEAFTPDKPEERTFGELDFVSGLVLSSDNDDFGGLSGMRIVNNKLFAVTDKGHFLTADINRNNNILKGLENAEISRLRDRKGKRLTRKKDSDAESLEISGSQFLVGFERKHRVEAFNLKKGKLFADERAKAIDFAKHNLPNNKGPEALALIPGTAKLLVFAEDAPNTDGRHRAFIVDGDRMDPIFVSRTVGYSLTDAAFLPDGNLIILERFYTPVTGPAMRFRRFEAENIKPDVVLEGTIIMEATSSMEIDNMEGLAITETDDGAVLLTIVSDDNFSRNQRTLLLEFKLSN